MWDKAKDFITKAFTIIFLASLIIWFLQTFDLHFNIVDEASLMQYIKPDFARLTDIGPSEDTDEDAKPDKKGLVAIKSGIKPKLREIEKKA